MKAYQYFKLAQKKIEDYTSEYFANDKQDPQADVINYFRDEIELYKRRYICHIIIILKWLSN